MGYVLLFIPKGFAEDGKKSRHGYAISRSPSVSYGDIMLQEAVYHREIYFAAGNLFLTEEEKQQFCDGCGEMHSC